MARFIIYKGDGLTNSPMTPTGYKFLGYDSGNLSEKTDNDISPIGGGGSSSFIGNTDTPNDYVCQSGKTVIVNGTEDALIFTDLPTGGGSVISGSFSDFQTLITNNALVKGSFYEMTDFETIYDQPDYDDANTPKAVVSTKSGGITPILLLATSSNTFAKEVWMPSRPQWKFEYDINFVQTEYMNAPAKGRITYAKDEFNNETTYDHDVVLLKRYESVSGSSVFDSFWDTGFASVEVKTFGSNCLSNTIKCSGVVLGENFHLNNVILVENSIFNTFEILCKDITILGGGNNHFGVGCFNIRMGSNIINNTFLGANGGIKTLDGMAGNYFEMEVGGDFTSATHVYTSYSCRIFRRQDSTVRLSYTNNLDVLVVVNPTT